MATPRSIRLYVATFASPESEAGADTDAQNEQTDDDGDSSARTGGVGSDHIGEESQQHKHEQLKGIHHYWTTEMETQRKVRKKKADDGANSEKKKTETAIESFIEID
jgi:hypothetical protein